MTLLNKGAYIEASQPNNVYRAAANKNSIYGQVLPKCIHLASKDNVNNMGQPHRRWGVLNCQFKVFRHALASNSSD
jgi:hypothetical protein